MYFLLIALFVIMILAGVFALVVFYQLEISDHEVANKANNNSLFYKK